MATTIDRLIAYWEEERLGAPMPQRMEISPARLARDGVLSACFVADLETGLLRVSGLRVRDVVGDAPNPLSRAFADGDQATIIECLDMMRRLECGWFLATSLGDVILLPVAIESRVCRTIGAVDLARSRRTAALELLAPPERRSTGRRPHAAPLLRVIEGGRK